MFGGVDVVLGPRGGCLSGIEHVSTGHSHEQWGDGESHGAIPERLCRLVVIVYDNAVLGVNLQQNIGLEKSQNIGDIG